MVLVNGLMGNKRNWSYIRKQLEAYCREQNPENGLMVHVSTSNVYFATMNVRKYASRPLPARHHWPCALALNPMSQGIDACGERLAGEIRAVIVQHPSLQEISFISHSLGRQPLLDTRHWHYRTNREHAALPGGLISRYAAGRLYDPATGLVAGLRPRHYISIASPHLGCTAEMSEAQARVHLLLVCNAGRLDRRPTFHPQVPFILWSNRKDGPIAQRISKLADTKAVDIASFM